MSINLSKEETINKINLNKEEVHNIRLSKKSLINQTIYGVLALDFSGSMNKLYKDGTVQSVIEKALPIAMEFDDDGEMEVWLFDDSYHRLPNISLKNIYDYVNREILNRYHMGGTCYAPVMKDIFNQYKKKTSGGLFRKAGPKYPEYVLFITDGDNSDKGNTNAIIKEVSKYPIFWQFIGIGNASFNYLRKLDDMTDRYVDNADFFAVNTIDNITYDKLFDEFPSYLTNEKVIKMYSNT